MGAISTTCTMSPTQHSSQLEDRVLQTRHYETKDVKMVIKAVMHTLQDDNYIIKQADIELGLLSAQKEEDLEPNQNTLSTVLGNVLDAHFQKHVITEVSANISEYNRDKTYVRINFQRK